MLSDVGEKQVVAVSYGDYKADDLRSMVKTAVGAIYGLGLSLSNANLINCHVVNGNRVIKCRVSRRLALSVVSLNCILLLWQLGQ